MNKDAEEEKLEMRTGEKEQLRERLRKSPEMGCWEGDGGTPSKGILGMPGAVGISLGGWVGGGRGPRPGSGGRVSARAPGRRAEWEGAPGSEEDRGRGW